MTVAKLCRGLIKLMEQGHGNLTVCVDKSKCTHPLEGDGVCIFPITSIQINTHEMQDEDGGIKTLSNGVTAARTALVIKAEH